MTPRLKSAPLAALLAIAGLLSGCGGGADSQSVAQTQVAVAGIAIDGVLKSAQVFLDLNNNGSLGPDEPTTLTYSNGAFTLMATPAQKSTHSVVVACSEVKDHERILMRSVIKRIKQCLSISDDKLHPRQRNHA